MAAAQRPLVFPLATALAVILLAGVGGGGVRPASAQSDRATNLNASATDVTTATLTWTAADNSSGASSYRLTVQAASESTTAANLTVSDVSTETYTVTGLTYSTYYTASLDTLDAAGQSNGVATVSFWTAYQTINGKFIAALSVLSFLFLTLATMMVLKSKYLSDAKMEDTKPVLKETEVEVEEATETPEGGTTKPGVDVEKSAAKDIVIF